MNRQLVARSPQFAAIRRGSRVAGLFALLLLLVQPLAQAQGVAMVTDVSGLVSGSVPVTITSELAADTRVQVVKGGTLVVIYLNSGDEYTFSGPAEIEFRAGQPQVVSGAAPSRRASPLAVRANVKIRPLGVSQGGFVMRSAPVSARIRLLSLARTTTLDPNPEFRWEADPKAKYRFELTDETGRSLHETEVMGGSFTLPDSMRLAEGVGYTWQVSARLADGRRYIGAGDFTIAAAELQAQARGLRPGDGSPVSERVAYAAWLEQVALRDEARKYWRALSAERPEDAKLKALAGE